MTATFQDNPSLSYLRTSRQQLLFPCERAVLLFLVLALALYAHFAIPLRDPGHLYRNKVAGGLMWYGTGLFICLFLQRLRDIQQWRKDGVKVSRKESWRRYRSQFLPFRRIIIDLRLVHAIALSFVVFIQLKHLTPQVNPRLYDKPLMVFDRLLCAGQLCATRVIHFFGFGAAEFMSRSYTFFFAYIGFLLLIMVLQRSQVLAQEFCLSFVLLWFVGALLIYLVPSWGPCYAANELFQGFPLTETLAVRNSLWEFKKFAANHPENSHAAFLISGFPSMHLAVPVLGTFYLKRVHFSFFLLSLLFSLITVVTTLYFGWHYALDEIGAVALALMIYKFCLFTNRNC